MKTKNPERFLKIAAFTIGLAILIGGTLTNAKNSSFVEKIDASLNSASATSFDSYSIPTKIGSCEQTSTPQNNETITAVAANLDTVLAEGAPLDTQFIDPITAGVLSGRLETDTVISGKKYDFTVTDGQTSFWKCLLNKHPLLSVAESAMVNDGFLSETRTFSKNVTEFDYSVGAQQEVSQFLNFVDAPNGEPILETTALNSTGEIFFKIFEMKKSETNYNELRKALRNRVGVTNLRPAVFGDDSYYWMWGENNKMAASVFTSGDTIFGVSYQTIHFKAIRRVMESLQTAFAELARKVEYLHKLNSKYADLTIFKFDQLSEEDFGSSIWQNLEKFGGSNLSANILEVSPIEQLEASATNTDFEPLALTETTEAETELIIPADF
ncbi:MAG: hypothetical protein K9L85_00435 [Candidatus Peribacteraceae bacterium]|nr:hypothetical protein [Candidatus Peribacteraceae bacterium]